MPDIYTLAIIRVTCAALIFIVALVVVGILAVTRPSNGVTKYFGATTFFLGIHMIIPIYSYFSVVSIIHLSPEEIAAIYYPHLIDTIALVGLLASLISLIVVTLRYENARTNS